MLTLIAAAALPLVAVTADDPRLADRWTFVSPEAQSAVAERDGEGVLCLDRSRGRYESICLTRGEWSEAVALANAGKGEKKRPLYVRRIEHSVGGPQSKYGLASSPSTFRTTR